MIRGISDMPASASGCLANPIWRLLTPLWRGASGAGTNEPDNWKPYTRLLRTRVSQVAPRRIPSGLTPSQHAWWITRPSSNGGGAHRRVEAQ
jgi:hypothetical protein